MAWSSWCFSSGNIFGKPSAFDWASWIACAFTSRRLFTTASTMSLRILTSLRTTSILSPTDLLTYKLLAAFPQCVAKGSCFGGVRGVDRVRTVFRFMFVHARSRSFTLARCPMRCGIRIGVDRGRVGCLWRRCARWDWGGGRVLLRVSGCTVPGEHVVWVVCSVAVPCGLVGGASRLGVSGGAVPWGLVGGVSFWVPLVSLCRGAGGVSCLVVLGFAESCQVLSCHLMSCHVLSCPVLSCSIASRRVASRRVASCRVVSCRVA